MIDIRLLFHELNQAPKLGNFSVAQQGNLPHTKHIAEHLNADVAHALNTNTLCNDGLGYLLLLSCFIWFGWLAACLAGCLFDSLASLFASLLSVFLICFCIPLLLLCYVFLCFACFPWLLQTHAQHAERGMPRETARARCALRSGLRRRSSCGPWRPPLWARASPWQASELGMRASNVRLGWTCGWLQNPSSRHESMVENSNVSWHLRIIPGFLIVS